jgi:hypothetical protein
MVIEIGEALTDWRMLMKRPEHIQEGRCVQRWGAFHPEHRQCSCCRKSSCLAAPRLFKRKICCEMEERTGSVQVVERK